MDRDDRSRRAGQAGRGSASAGRARRRDRSDLYPERDRPRFAGPAPRLGAGPRPPYRNRRGRPAAHRYTRQSRRRRPPRPLRLNRKGRTMSKDKTETPVRKGGKMKKLLLIYVGAAVLIGAGAGAGIYMGGGLAAEAPQIGRAHV